MCQLEILTDKFYKFADTYKWDIFNINTILTVKQICKNKKN